MEQGRQNINRLSITIGIACFLWMLNFLGITPFYPFIAEDLNTPVALVGQITALIAIVSIPVGIITGPVADRFGYRNVLLGGILTLSIGSLTVALAPSYKLLLMLVPFGAISQATVRPLSIAIAGAHLAEVDRRRAVGLATVGMSTAGVLGIPVLTLIGGFWGWRTSFVCLTVLNVVATIFLVRSIPRDVPDVDRLDSPPLNPRAYAWMLTDLATVLLIASTFLRESGIWGFYTFRGAFFVEIFGIGRQHIGWVFSIAGIGLLSGSAIAGSHRFKLPLHLIALLGIAIMTLCCTLTLVLPLGLIVAVALTMLTAFGLGFAMVATDTLIVNLTKGGRATTTSLNRAAANIGTAIGGISGGLALSQGGYRLLGISALIFGAAAFIAVAASMVRRRTTVTA